MHTHFLASLVLFLTFTLGFPQIANAHSSLKEIALDAVSENTGERASALAALRLAGPAGLDALFEAHADEINHHLSPPSHPDSQPETHDWRRLADALDKVSRQRDSYASRLYWYTDLESAKAAAAASGKPILSLRLLGNLDEEFSCANSRFFRTTLYANADISKFLRERFVLHWKSVRPVPRVTIDYGDGRKLERTLTGNSIHYVLDARGRPVDALPGLYGPAAFLRSLKQIEGVARESTRLSGPQRGGLLRGYHAGRLRETNSAYQADAARVGGMMPLRTVTPARVSGDPPTAVQAAPLAITKMGVEMRTVRALTYVAGGLPAATDAAAWDRIAALHLADARLDQSSINLIRRHHHYTHQPASASRTKTLLTETALSRIVRNLERSIALDTVRNEYVLRATIHSWFVSGAEGADVEGLNERVYAELFLTPSSDLWLGLVSPDTYTGLRSDGVVEKE